MQFNARSITGDAAALERGHEEALARLPATIQAFILVELRKWPTLFAPEQRYQRALLEHISALPLLICSRLWPASLVSRRSRAATESATGSRRGFRKRPRRCCESAAASSGGRRSMFFQTVEPCSTLDFTPRMRPVAWSSKCMAAASHRSRQTMEPLQRDRRSSAARLEGDEGIRGISPGAVRWTRRWRHGAGAARAATSRRSCSAGYLDRRVTSGAS